MHLDHLSSLNPVVKLSYSTSAEPLGMEKWTIPSLLLERVWLWLHLHWLLNGQSKLVWAIECVTMTLHSLRLTA